MKHHILVKHHSLEGDSAGTETELHAFDMDSQTLFAGEVHEYSLRLGRYRELYLRVKNKNTSKAP